MPSYRINYLGRTRQSPGTEPGNQPFYANPAYVAARGESVFFETEFQDEVDASTPASALDAFFWQHADRREDVMLKGNDGRGHPIEGVADYDPNTIYIWIEDNWFMEYQGIEELKPGRVPCPMCNGDGEIEETLVDFYDEISGRRN